MLRIILGTTGSKFLIAVLGFLVVLLNTRYLGAEGFGTIGLIGLAITIILLFNNFIGGTALIYLASREDMFKLLVPGYVWAFIISIVFSIIIRFLRMVPSEFEFHVVLLSLIFSLAGVNLNLLLGKEKIRAFNIITVLQSGIQLISLIVLFFILHRISIISFVITLYISFLLTLLLSSISLARIIKPSDLGDIKEVIKRIFHFGSYIQVAYTLQLFNYRMSYYIIDHFLGRASVGMFHFGNQLAEGTWVIGRSIATVQYAKVSNTTDLVYARKLSLNMLKLTFLVSTVMVLGFLIIPESVFHFFGKDFGKTRIIMLSLGVGIIANACSMMFSHYFAGLGKPHFNTIASAIGLVFTLTFGFILIPRYGIIGAGFTATISYTLSMIYQFFTFFWFSGAKFKEILISRSDIDMVKKELKLLFNS